MHKETMKQAKTNNSKEPVKIRYQKLKNGNLSVYLDTYLDGVRRYEFLKLYLIPETTPEAKRMNAATLKAVNTIKAQRVIDIVNGKAGITNSDKGKKIPISEFIAAFKAKKERNNIDGNTMKILAHHLEKLGVIGVPIGSVDKNFVLKFADYLRGLNIAQSTRARYFTALSECLNEAVRHDFITVNPFSKLDNEEKIRKESGKREYLTGDEIKQMINTDIERDDIKRMFLFSCFTGLRSGDIKRITWNNIESNGKQSSLRLRMQKTRKEIVIPLSRNAMCWLPKRKDAKGAEPIFGYIHNTVICRTMKLWVAKAGINKRITFHCARHTFATLLITYKVDLYTVSKLLGHTDIRITQIYAKLIDQNKIDAINIIDEKFK